MYMTVYKHEGGVCTSMGRNGLITCAREVITCARELITCARELITCARKKFSLFSPCPLSVSVVNRLTGVGLCGRNLITRLAFIFLFAYKLTIFLIFCKLCLRMNLNFYIVLDIFLKLYYANTLNAYFVQVWF